MSTVATPNVNPQVEPLTKRKAWKALQAHYETIRGVHHCAASSPRTQSAASG